MGSMLRWLMNGSYLVMASIVNASYLANAGALRLDSRVVKANSMADPIAASQLTRSLIVTRPTRLELLW